ncbi:MAG: dihydrodipicolinate synthase family protein [Planctomycetia bacterium]|nr:dihydrodipicolinate synthase family protein [Planctomycetia bacterium]
MVTAKASVGDLRGVWSATPTPFTDKMELDAVSVRRMIDHHLRIGVTKLFLAGTCGEGPWMTDAQRRGLLKTASEYAAGRMVLAVQVTDTSPGRILDNIHQAKEDGAHVAVIAPPSMFMNPTPKRLLDHYVRAISQSPLPVGIYDRGASSAVAVPDAVMKKIVAHKNVILVKDSSSDPRRRAVLLAARRANQRLCLFDGDEFHCLEYLEAGYDGLLLGGGIFNGYLAGKLIEAVRDGNRAEAERIDQRIIRINYAVYGGKTLGCWLSGLKELLVAMNVFRTAKSHLDYPMTAACRRAIRRVLEKDRDVLLP